LQLWDYFEDKLRSLYFTKMIKRPKLHPGVMLKLLPVLCSELLPTQT